MSVFDEKPSDLTQDEIKLLVEWGNLSKIQAPSADDPMFRLQVTKAVANILKWSEAFGPRMVSMLVKHKRLNPEEDPIAALQRLLDDLHSY